MTDNNQNVDLLDTDGNIVTGPASMAAQALQVGYKPATPENIAHAEAIKKFGPGIANKAAAFAAGAARGATLNISDPVLTHLGITSPETLAGLAEAHPALSFAGQVAGTGAALALAPGEGELAAADLINPISAASKIGGATAKALAPAAAEAGAGLGTRAAIAAGQIGAKGLGSAVEGAFYGLGQTVTESALGDPDVTAERLMDNVGYGALLGGALGSTVEAGKMAIPKSLGAAKEAVQGGWNKIWGDARAPEIPESFMHLPTGEAPAAGVEIPTWEGEGGAATPPEGEAPLPSEGMPQPGILPRIIARIKQATTGTPAEETEAAFATRGAAGKELLTKEERTQFQKELGESIQDVHDKTEAALKDAIGTARAQETDALLKDSSPAAAQAEFARVNTQLDHTIAEMRSRPSLYPGHFPENLEDVKADLQAAVHENSPASDYFHAINEAKQAIDTKLPWGSDPSGSTKNAVALIKGLRGDLRSSLENEDVWGSAAARQAAFNNTYSQWKTVTGKRSPFRQLFMKQIAGSGGSTKWVVNQNKLGQFLNQINDARGMERADALRNVFRSAHDAIGEIDNTYKNAPFEHFDAESHRALIQRNIDQATRAQNIVGAQNIGYGGLFGLGKILLAGHFGGPLGAAAVLGKHAVEAATNPEVVAGKLANIEKAASKTTDIITNGVKGLFSKSEALKALKGPTIQELENHKDRIKQVTKMTANPGVLVDNTVKNTQMMADVAPKVTSGVNNTVARATQFLASKVPQVGPSMPFSKPPEPSDLDLQRFDRYYRVVEKPTSILEQMKTGELKDESLEALRTVYPKLNEQMQTEIMSQMASLKDPTKVPYQTRMMISKFMGQPMDVSLLPQNIQTMNGAMIAAAAQEQANKGGPAGARPTSKALGNIDIASRSATLLSQTSQRE